MPEYGAGCLTRHAADLAASGMSFIARAASSACRRRTRRTGFVAWVAGDGSAACTSGGADEGGAEPAIGSRAQLTATAALGDVGNASVGEGRPQSQLHHRSLSQEQLDNEWAAVDLS